MQREPVHHFLKKLLVLPRDPAVVGYVDADTHQPGQQPVDIVQIIVPPGYHPSLTRCRDHFVLEIAVRGKLTCHDLLKYRVDLIPAFRFRQYNVEPALSKDLFFLVTQKFKSIRIDGSDRP